MTTADAFPYANTLLQNRRFKIIRMRPTNLLVLLAVAPTYFECDRTSRQMPNTPGA
jgi:hypothetical protein